jgi:UDP-sulfoquinovose synthase
VRIYNQMTETHRVIDLARIVSNLTGAEIDLVDNPRNEASENDLVVENRRLLDLGLEPITLEDGLLEEVTEIAKRYADRCDLDKIPARSLWRPRRIGQPADEAVAVDVEVATTE